ncbi:GtrA family protein [Candidatus Parcubacteria bacterium]|jgi:putative flippase GtrA|nr:GtrA family protein [Candidatus Parcubacteria bacterium]MBT3949013.1 GtrA family protein [Candidatus Parcubacteria bacterium]
MIKRTARYFWSVRHQFAKYFVVGFSGVFLDMGTLILFKEKFGWTPVFAVVINQIFLLTYNFFLNKYWSFRNREMPHKQLVRFLSLAGFNYVFSVIMMYIFSDHFNFDYRLVRIGTIIVMVSWNFFLYKYWVYREVEEKE